MKPLILLIAVFAAFVAGSKAITGNWNILFGGNLAMCMMLFLTATGHVLFTKGMAMMIPPFIPYKTGLVYITGVIEVLLGLGLLSQFLRPYAGYTLIVFFILILPANVYAAAERLDLEKGTFTGPGLAYLWFRIPEQLFFILWVYYFGV